MVDLTKRQEVVYKFITSYIAKESVPPTIREIALGLDLPFGSSAQKAVDALVKKGYIRIKPRTARNIRLVEGKND